MRFFVFNVWNDEEDGHREVLVAGTTEGEAENRLSELDLEYDDYSLEEEVYYDGVFI